ncbi:Abi family protein [Bifidobacterium sp. 82T10]|uniref:Abi family protein n=1 Tax=Bifidobacterium miconis TaxID=2834435 RepID=A0ABS6WH84_9BIFI|nr:Abi family protein [Bifidobacterium miconis]
MTNVGMLNFLSESRFQTYRDYVHTRHPELDDNTTLKLAINLYRWNVTASSTVMAYVSYVEVFVRNAIDRELRAWVNEQSAVMLPDWISPYPIDPISRIRNLVNTADTDYLESARISALNKQRQWKSDQHHPRHGDYVNRDDIFAQLNFGTWDGMLGRADKDPELVMVLMGAFPDIESAWQIEERRMPKAQLPGSDSADRSDRLRREMANRLKSIRNIRNRAGHEDNLLRVDFPQLRHNMLFVLGALDQRCVGWAFPDGAERLKTLDANTALHKMLAALGE